MAQKYQCPVCGATHKELQDQCRLCGQTLGPEAVVGDPQQAKVVMEERRGIGAIVLVVVLLVVAIVVAAVLLGAVPGTKTIDAVKNKAGLNVPADGWSRFDNPAGGFSIEFPEGDRKNENPTDTYRSYTLIGRDTLLLIEAKRLMSQEEFNALSQSPDEKNSLKRKMTAVGDDLEAVLKADNVKIDKRTDTTAFGVPAMYLETRDAKPALSGLRTDTSLFSRDMFFLKDGVLYDVTVVSVYRNPEQFDRVLNSLQINGPPGSSAGTTVAP